jgi:phosphoribosylformylglycinamidine synthase
MRTYQVYVTAKTGIFDPAGAQAQYALDNLGLSGFEDVKIGKYIQLTCDDQVELADVQKACDKLLANPVIEDYRIEQA